MEGEDKRELERLRRRDREGGKGRILRFYIKSHRRGRIGGDKRERERLRKR